MTTRSLASLAIPRAPLAMLGAALTLAASTPALAQVPQVFQGDIGIELQPIATGLVSPIEVTHAGDNSGRLFVVDQTGKILIIQNGQVLPTPFLDLTSTIPIIILHSPPPHYHRRRRHPLLSLLFARGGAFFFLPRAEWPLVAGNKHVA